VNPVTVGNALDLLTRRGVLRVQTAKEGRRYARGAAHDELFALRERLAAALASR
jgi:hypothetical protein